MKQPYPIKAIWKYLGHGKLIKLRHLKYIKLLLKKGELELL